LLKRDMKTEREVMMQCIVYFVKQNFFEGMDYDDDEEEEEEEDDDEEEEEETSSSDDEDEQEEEQGEGDRIESQAPCHVASEETITTVGTAPATQS
jgi:hypothetical protein